MKRAKCISTRQFSDSPPDPFLVKGQFYPVTDSEVFTIANPEPYIEIRLPSGMTIQRPRHLFIIVEKK